MEKFDNLPADEKWLIEKTDIDLVDDSDNKNTDSDENDEVNMDNGNVISKLHREYSSDDEDEEQPAKKKMKVDKTWSVKWWWHW